ncbi:glycosyl transferase [Leptolyngbya sp. 'hensonii']|nr:glycosyl transferase [Leptolyngbya sp. 'hensonii']
MPPPTFTIVITTFNRWGFLNRAIDSALNQSLPCEVIVIDDASTDETAQRMGHLVSSLQDQGDARLKYVRNESNCGHSQSVNVGVAEATGTWIKFLDDDDYLAPNCIEVMLQAIALHPTAVICSGQAIQVNSGGHLLGCTPSIGPVPVFHIPQVNIHRGMLLEQVAFGTPVQVAVSREAFLKSGGWDIHLTVCDDIDSWVRIAQFGDAIFINQGLAYRTVWEGGSNRKNSIQERLNTNLKIKQKIYAHIRPEHQAQLPSIKDIQNYLNLHWGFVALKDRQLFTGLKLLLPSVPFLMAWKLLLQARTKQHQLPAPMQVIH